LRLERISSAPEANDPTAASTRVDVDDPEYRELNARLAECRHCREIGDWRGAARPVGAPALASGPPLGAARARAERAPRACGRDSTGPAALEQRVPHDSWIAAVRAGLAWRDSAGAVAALSRLDRVNGAGLRMGYVLDHLRGRARLAVGDVRIGSYLMMGGL